MGGPMESDEIVPSSQPLTDVIRPIGRDTVHRICSGQVVLSLAIAVKELVENAIDAGATIIDIRLKNYGADLIEVSDNGKGIIEENFQTLTLKHYTSKIRKFSDLASIGTLGFRGEALSSLCALSDLKVLTKHCSSKVATKISYDRNGKIVDEVLTAREQGTTVILENLFSTLPVRRKEFLKNLKREFNKACQLLYAYCLVCKEIKFSCSNLTSSGSKTTVVATEGSKTVRDNIINVFGPKQISSLIEVEVVRPEDPILGEFGIQLVEGEELPFSFQLLTSSVTHGSGRSSTDRQFFYVNSRPCEPTKIAKLINEIYKQYNSNQYPFVYLNVTSKSSLVDVNVTPDKRQVFFENEKVLLAMLKASLNEAFKAFPSTFKVQNLDVSATVANSRKDRGLKRNATEGSIKRGSILERFQKRSKTESDKEFLLTKQKSESHQHDTSSEALDSFIEIACELTKKRAVGQLPLPSSREVTVAEKPKNESKSSLNSRLGGEVESVSTPKLETFSKLLEKKSVSLEEQRDLVTDDKFEIELSIDAAPQRLEAPKSVKVEVSIESLRQSLGTQTKTVESEMRVRFRSRIAPETNKSAEEELQKQISKEDFAKMEIIGQFNLGFIVAKLGDDLFIIDQHATDEKYNFEQLQAHTVLENQVLVSPKVLELTAGNEGLLIENEEIFRKNGFNFKIDQESPSTKKVSLTSIPVSKNYVFGKDDIEEMLFMLQDSNGTMCRPSRIRTMFASRACRKSVMIGKSLTKSDMRKLINHMGEIEQPWNCPHGRPTMRHLLNLGLIQKDL